MAPDVREMRPDDLEAGLRLSTSAGWNQRLDDWQRLAAMAGHGAFVAESEGIVVGTSMGLDYGRFGWIAMMLVDPTHRGQGIGRRLLDAAMRALPATNPIGLDATPAGRPLYTSRGFTGSCTLSRLMNRPGSLEWSGAGDVHPLTRDALGEILAADMHVFAASRAHVLEWALAETPHLCWMATDGETIVGYCFGRRGRLFDQVGPVVASSDAIAAALIGRARAAHDPARAMIADVFNRHTGVHAWMQTHGFTPERPLYRMWRPSTNARRLESSELSGLREFAIFGPDCG